MQDGALKRKLVLLMKCGFADENIPKNTPSVIYYWCFFQVDGASRT